MTITAVYQYTYNSVPGGGAPFGSSVSYSTPSGAGSSQVTIAVVYSTRNSTAQTFTPGPGWTVLSTRQQQLSRIPTSTPYNESFAGTNPEYVTITTLVAVGAAGTTLTGTFPVGVYYSLSFWRFNGVDLTSPVIGATVTGRSLSGNNTSYPVSWSPSFSDTVSITAKGGSVLIPYYHGGISFGTRYNSNAASVIPQSGTVMNTVLPITTHHTYTLTPSIYIYGTSMASLVVLREALYVPGQCEVFTGVVTDVTAASGVQLSVASSAFPDALSNYGIDFIANTTGNASPPNGLLSAGPWTLGPMATGQAVTYRISRLDGAHINGSAVMRATDTAFGLFWDLTVQCTPFASQALIF